LQNRDKPEASNEQRLPLKKRHYHVSNTTTQSGSESADKSESSPDSKDSKVHLKSNTSPSEKEKCEKHNVGGKSGHVGGKSMPQMTSSNKVGSGRIESRRNDRNSIDEAIEACITKYADHESVIVTPKKRHRLEMDNKKPTTGLKNLCGKDKDSSSPSTTKRSLSRVSNTSNQNRAASPQGAKRQSTRNASTKSEVEIPKTPNLQTVPNQTPLSTKRTSQRIQMVSNADQPEKLEKHSAEISTAEAQTQTKRVLRGSDEPQVQTSCGNKKTDNSTHTAVAPKEAAEDEKSPSKPDSLAKVTSVPAGALGTRSASKLLGMSSSANSLITPIPPPLECVSPKSPRSKHEKKPPAGVFEPSSKTGADALVNIIKIPDSPVKCVAAVLSKIKDKLSPIENLNIDISDSLRNLRIKRTNEELESNDHKEKKRKVLCDLRVHVTKLSPTDEILKKVMNSMKLKVRRRKTINRTGFPVKKKKKKKPPALTEPSLMLVDSDPSPPPILEDQTKLPVITSTDESTPALSPITKVEELSKVKDEEKFEMDLEVVIDKGDAPIKTELKTPKTEVAQQHGIGKASQKTEKSEQRPGSKRLMELRAKTVASERRKRKKEEPSESPNHETENLSESSCSGLEVIKKLRKTKEEPYDR
jgi:hypothetical protein